MHNHLDILKRSLASYEKFIDYPKRFVFHNTNSQYKPCLDFLKERELQGDLVYHTNINHHLSVINTIRKYLSEHPDAEYYILTDPDIELNNAKSNLVETFIYLLNKYNVYSVGTSLKIDDIPDYYPKKQLVLSIPTHKSFHSSPRIQENFQGQDFEITVAPIDTTFQLIRARNIDERFPHANCLRVFEPYDARHLDWYINPNDMTDCQKFYHENATSISHWNNPNWNR